MIGVTVEVVVDVQLLPSHWFTVFTVVVLFGGSFGAPGGELVPFVVFDVVLLVVVVVVAPAGAAVQTVTPLTVPATCPAGQGGLTVGVPPPGGAAVHVLPFLPPTSDVFHVPDVAPGTTIEILIPTSQPDRQAVLTED